MIRILERLRPFSHQPGAACLIPTTSYVVQAFPSKLLIYDLEDSSHKVVKEIPLKVEGFLKQFTLLQDLEGGFVSCFSEAYSFFILPNLDVVEKRVKSEGLSNERLSFGMHKKQEVEALRARLDVRELLPLWFQLGSNCPLQEESREKRGVFSLLEACRQSIAENHPEKTAAHFERLFVAGFSSFFVPRLQDCEHRALFEPCAVEQSPLLLLSEGARLIRSLFFKEDEQGIHILPHLLPQCAAGKMMHLHSDIGIFDIEWSKKAIKKVILRATREAELKLIFVSSIKSYRLQEAQSKRVIKNRVDQLISIEPKKVYHLDCFQK